MGWFFRKSISLGGVRLNFSKSGVGVSAGVKGGRCGVGPRGSYVHAGRNGFYYRKNYPLSPHDIADNKECEAKGNVSWGAEADYLNIAKQIKQNRHKFTFWPLAVLLVFIPKIGVFLAPVTALLLYIFIDRRIKKSPVLFIFLHALLLH